MADEPAGGQAATFTKEQVEAEVAGLKKKNAELLEKLAQVNTVAKQFEGLDPEKVKAAIAAAEKAEAERAKATGDWEAREKALRDSFAAEHAKVVEPLTGKVQKLEADLFNAIAVRDAVQATALPTIKGNSKLLLPVLTPELGIEVVDGQPVTVVKGKDGKPRYHQTTGALVTVEDRLLELRAMPEFFGAFEGAGTSGGGASSASASAGAAATIRAGDDKAFLANVGKIAKGEVKVTT